MPSSQSEHDSRQERRMANAAVITVGALKSNPFGMNEQKQEQTFGKVANNLLVQQKNNLTQKPSSPQFLS